MSLLLVHVVWLWSVLLGRPSGTCTRCGHPSAKHGPLTGCAHEPSAGEPSCECAAFEKAADEEAARAGAYAAERLPHLVRAIADGHDRVLLITDATGPSWRSLLDPDHRERNDTWSRPAWTPLRGALAGCGHPVLVPDVWGGFGPLLFVGNAARQIDLAHKQPSGRDVMATIAGMPTSWDTLTIASGRTSLCALAGPGIRILREIRKREDGWTWSLEDEAATRARLGYDPRLVAEVAALASLEGVGADTARALVCGGRIRKATVEGYGSVHVAVQVAAAVPAGDRLPGLDRRQMAALRDAAKDGGAGILRALAIHGLRDDAPIDMALVRGAADETPTDAHAGEERRAPALGCVVEVGQTTRASSMPRAEVAARAAKMARADGHDEIADLLVQEARARREREESEKMSQPNGNGNRQQGQQPQQPRGPKAERADRIRRIFAAKAKELAAVFPTNGEVLVARAQATALAGASSLHVDVTADSIAEAAIACHHLGLEIGDQAYLVPYKDKGTQGTPKAKLMVGPRGLIALAFRSGFVKSIVARSVFEGDDFAYNLGTNEIRHVKLLGSPRDGISRRPTWADDKGEVRPVAPENLITHAYVRIETTTDGTILEVLTWEDLAFYRSFSKSDSGPWFDNFEGMARKTAIKRGLEFVPRSPLLAAALRENDEGAYVMDADMRATVDELLRGYRERKSATSEEKIDEEALSGAPSGAEVK